MILSPATALLEQTVSDITEISHIKSLLTQVTSNRISTADFINMKRHQSDRTQHRPAHYKIRMYYFTIESLGT